MGLGVAHKLIEENRVGRGTLPPPGTEIAIAGAHFLDQFLQSRAGNCRASGIVGRSNQNAAGLGTPVLANVLGT